ncbi:hypothetical protein B1806_08810 [Metallibacterium scheffleri]|uniref:DUF2975 domain-containing protein n=1 Tax=Metallibacterium scheffleri TaxID=993689 RepID=A0A4S3KN08_9GAMM|nr:hypothetical protein B1806_08810 [Metallibacterium scheffleri]
MIVAFVGLAIALGGMANPQSRIYRELHAQLLNVPTAWVVSDLVAFWSAQILMLWSLRQLARALYEGPLLSVLVARRFRAFGNWLLLCLLVGLLGNVGDALFVPTARIQLGDGLFMTVILALLCRAISSIVLEGARAADENRGFV